MTEHATTNIGVIEQATLHMHKTLLSDLSAFDLLVYASLYAFERLVPRDLSASVTRHRAGRPPHK
jgi:hypothetical protein